MFISANIFQPLIDVFQSVLLFFHNSLGVPWGWAIVLLTICVRAALIPLTVKQIGSMARLQALQPELKAVQAKYKDDKQRQQQEIMKFYKENHVNPLGSCLPMVAQLPVFISLYYMLRQSLRVDICPGVQRLHNHGVLSIAHTVPCGPHGGASFLFISDLTNKATGITLVILVVLYIGTQLASTLMMSGAAMEPTQRYMMLGLPLIFVLFVIRFPAGVLVYWITTNTWTIGQQYIVRRRIGPIRAARAGAVAGDGDGGSGEVKGSAAPRGPASPRPKPAAGKTLAADSAKAAGNGAASGGGSRGGLGGLMHRTKPPEEPPKVRTGARGGPPPQPPRKKKKRSGRRR
ncbi:MAG: YidC/Oxa1 family membrane protein insertase [Solirubrobacteraceae bacterium]